MLSTTILTVSLALQVSAALLSLRLIRVTGRGTAWVLLSLALGVQVVRRLLVLAAAGTTRPKADPLAETAGLMISALMLAAVWFIKEHFQHLAEREARYHALFTSSFEAVLLTSPDGSILSANPAACALFGRTEEELKRLGRPAVLDLAEARAEAALAERERTGPFVGELTYLHSSGRRFPAEVASVRFRDGQGHPRTSLTVRDLRERRRTEADRSRREAESLQIQKARSLGLMAGAVAHHLNNKLQAVSASLEILARRSSGPGTSEALATARQATLRASEVGRMMQAYLGRTPAEREPLLLAPLCAGALPDLPLDLLAPAPGPEVLGNAEELRQVLDQLAANAREALDGAPGGVRLTLGTCPAADIPAGHRFPIGWQPQAPVYARLEVADTGCGMEEGDLEKVFDPFFTTKFTGRGLGLPVALGIVRGHGGAIAVESVPGAGSTFRVYLPATGP